MTQYNIYFGTIGKALGVRYRFSKWCKTENEASEIARNAAAALYYKYEGKYGLPTYSQIQKESEITGVDIEKLYNEYIADMCRWYAIPTDDDTIPNKKIKF